MKNTNTKAVELNEMELDAVNGGISETVKDIINVLPAGSLVRDIMDDADGTSKLSGAKIAKDIVMGVIDGSIIGYPFRAVCSAIWNFFD